MRDAPAHGAAPEVSIVICTRDRGSRLGGTLRSLARIESRRGWDVLVVDSASTDDTPRVLAGADPCGGRLRVLRLERPGLGAARDAGWRATRGRIVAFTDDDCYLEPDFVDAVAAVFDDHPDTGCVGGRILLYDPDDIRVTIDERDEPAVHHPGRFVDAGIVQGANMAFRRTSLERIGGFDPALGAGTPFPCEDIDAVAALLWSGADVRFDPRPVVWHHHRRREADLDAIWQGYDRGRGAYYAKYLLRPDTRRAYAAAWWEQIRTYDLRWQFNRLLREFGSAVRYLRGRSRPAVAATAAVAAAILLLVACRIAWRLARGRLRGGTAAPAAPADGDAARIRAAEDGSAGGGGADPGGIGRCDRAGHLAPDPLGMDAVGPDQTFPDPLAVPAPARGLDPRGFDHRPGIDPASGFALTEAGGGAQS